MIRILALLFLIAPLFSTAQELVSKSRSDLKYELNKYIEGNSSKSPKLIESDSALVLTVFEPGIEQVKHVFKFDAAGKCKLEKILVTCDSCVKEELNKVLEKKDYQWKKINENQYISRYSDQLLIELPVEKNDFYFTIYRAQWTKEVYDILIKN